MITTIHPEDMTAGERLAEVAAILAAGIARMKKKEKTEKFPLDESPNPCLHGRKENPGRRRP
ncbi:MAG: hypothetical protein HQL76_05990 [Magnetococcales bacterium]|nr:hypothetical protein [Magnetococcales bacterium]